MAEISRREFIRISTLTAAGLMAAACAKTAEPTAAPKVETPAPKVEATATPKPVEAPTDKESPMLVDLVKAGKLPPVEDRVAGDAQIIKPWHETGEYGGMYTVINQAADAFHDARTGVGIEGVLRIASNLKVSEPNIVKTFEFDAEGKVLTCALRQGMRFSDGEPVTADDFVFWYEDVVLNDELSPTKPTWFKPQDKLGKVVKLDDYTIQYAFEVPYPFVTKNLSHWDGTYIVKAAHFCQQYHANYVDKADLEAKAKGEQYDTWMAYYNRMTAINSGQALHNPDIPVLNPFRLLEETQEHWLLDRNPYYWKTDTDGNQLPYIDKCLIRIVNDAQARTAAIIAGESDVQFGWHPGLPDWPLYKKGEADGQYVAFTVPDATGATTLFQPNLTYAGDLVLRDIFRDKRFRIALSLAINRQEINDLVYFGKAVPQQATVIPSCSMYEERWAKLNTEYDPDKANSLLDEMGLAWDANHEWRLRPDGQPLAWTIESQIDPQTDQAWQLVEGYWKALGCDVQVKTTTGELIAQRYPSNEVQMGTWGADKATDWLFPTTPQFWVPYNRGWESTMYPLWSLYMVTEGKDGEEPPQEIKDLWDWWQAMKTSVKVEDQVMYGKKIVERNAEEMYVIGTVAQPPRPVIIKDNLGNMPTAEEGLEFGWDYLQFYPWHNEQLYLKQPLYPRQQA